MAIIELALALAAILDAPFLLSALAMAVMGSAMLGYRGAASYAPAPGRSGGMIGRDAEFFLAFYGAAAVIGLLAPCMILVSSAVDNL